MISDLGDNCLTSDLGIDVFYAGHALPFLEAANLDLLFIGNGLVEQVVEVLSNVVQYLALTLETDDHFFAHCWTDRQELHKSSEKVKPIRRGCTLMGSAEEEDSYARISNIPLVRLSTSSLTFQSFTDGTLDENVAQAVSHEDERAPFAIITVGCNIFKHGICVLADVHLSISSDLRVVAICHDADVGEVLRQKLKRPEGARSARAESSLSFAVLPGCSRMTHETVHEDDIGDSLGWRWLMEDGCVEVFHGHSCRRDGRRGVWY